MIANFRSKGQAGLRKGSTGSTRPQRGAEGAKDILHLNESKRWSRLTSAATRGSLTAETRRSREQWKIRIKRKIKIKSFGQKSEAREILDTDYTDEHGFLDAKTIAAKRHKRRDNISTEANGGNKEGKSFINRKGLKELKELLQNQTGSVSFVTFCSNLLIEC